MVLSCIYDNEIEKNVDFSVIVMCITTQISHTSEVYDSEIHIFPEFLLFLFLFYFPQDFLTPTRTAPRTNRNENTPMCLSNVY